ncbi:MAG: PEP-utilizing enzyme [Patescibacteria group bacterium]
MAKNKHINWQKVVSRQYSFLYSDYTNEAYKSMRKTVGTTLRYNLFCGDIKILNIYREQKDVDRSYRMINKMATHPRDIVAKMDRYDELVFQHDQLVKGIKRLKDKQEIKQKLLQLDKIFFQIVGYFLLFVFMGYAGDWPNIKKFLKRYGKRFERIRMYTTDMDMNIGFPKLFAKYDRRLLELAPSMKRKELLVFLKTGQLDQKKIRARAKSYLVITKDLKSREYALSDIPKVLAKELAHLKIDYSVKHLSGMAACPGTAQGRAVVVMTSSDYKKIKSGDILITPMTKPDIIAYLKKVKGIVTNDGGALSHASIISREMKIPCITGTKYATDIIKDGEMLKLSATKGLVEKIK